MSDEFDDIDFDSLSEREILIILARGQKAFHGRLSDHGKRLKALEAFRNWAAGAGAVAGAVGAMLKLKVNVHQG